MLFVLSVHAMHWPSSGASHLQLTHLAWRHARAVLLSLTALLLSLSAYSLLLDSPFTPLSARITNAQFVPPTLVQPAGDGSLSFFGVLGTGIGAMSAALTAQLGADASATPFDARYYSFYQWTGLTPPEDNVIDSIWFALIGAVAAAVVAAGLLYRHRARCEQLFRLFLVADLFLIFAVGGGSFALCTGALFNTSVDWVWYLAAMANLGACGCFALYGPSEASEKAARGVADDSTRVHAAALLFLNAVMAVMMTSVLNPFIVLLFLLLMALADLVAEARPAFGNFTGFILPAELEFLYATPRIMLTFGRIKLRASDFIWYALLIASLPARLGSALYPCVVCCLLAVAFAAFYAPFAGLRIRRPLPFATAAAVPALVIGALCGEGFAHAVCAGVF